MKTLLFLSVILLGSAFVTLQSPVGQYMSAGEGSNAKLVIKTNGEFVEIFHHIHTGKMPGTWKMAGDTLKLLYSGPETSELSLLRKGNDTLMTVEGTLFFVRMK